MKVEIFSYKQWLETDCARIESKIGHKVTVNQGNGRQKKHIEWEVVNEHAFPEENKKDGEYIGLTGLDLAPFDDEVIFARVFIHLFCKDIDEMTAWVNAAIMVYNHHKCFSLGKIKHYFFTSEIIVGFAIMIGGGGVGGNGCMTWRSERKRRENIFLDSIASSRCQNLKNWGCHTGGLNNSASFPCHVGKESNGRNIRVVTGNTYD
jgi:hypothetical protein